MVMKKNVMRKNLRQSILKSITRYIAIVAIIALGAGMFVGLRSTKTDMIATGQLFMDQTNMFDLRLASTLGWGVDDVETIAAITIIPTIVAPSTNFWNKSELFNLATNSTPYL